MANITTFNTTAVQLTNAEQWIQLIGFYILLTGPFATIPNILITVNIFKNKKLRTRFFVILGFLTIARIIFGLQMMAQALYRILRTLNLAKKELTVGVCYTIHFNLYYSLTLEMAFLLVLVLDRIIALTAINYYRGLTARQAINMCMLTTVIIITIKQVPSLLGLNYNQLISCINGYTPLHPIFNNYNTILDLIIIFLVIMLYLGLIAYLKFFKLPQALAVATCNENAHAAMIALKRQMKLMPLLRRLVLIHSCITGIAKILLWLSAFIPEHQQHLNAAGGCTSAIDLSANAIMLLASNRDLREISFWKRTTRVSSLNNKNSVQQQQ